MKEYLDGLRHIVNNGWMKPTRAKIDGRNISALSVFGYQMRFDLTAGFPILTTKHVSFKNVATELMWLVSGSTNIKFLQDNNCKIWDAWADERGEVGTTYGFQWRNFGGTGTDQLRNVIGGILEAKEDTTASISRRLIVTAWNPAQMEGVKLPPCHILFQFNVRKGIFLDCMMTQRSADVFLGVPYNIASYALLTNIIAKATQLLPGDLVIGFGDLHIYENHLSQVTEQLTRQPKPLPWLNVKQASLFPDNWKLSDIELMAYDSYPKLLGEVAV